AADLEYFKSQLEPYRNKPEFIAPGPAFDAKSCMQGKTIMTIPVTTANPFTQNINDAMEKVANEVGFKLIRWENQGQPTQWAQGVNSAINQKVDLIDLVGGTDPRVMVPQME